MRDKNSKVEISFDPKNEGGKAKKAENKELSDFMKAVILAGGEGTRLRPLTQKKPKPLISIVGIPMIERVIRALESYKIEKIIIVVKDKVEIKKFVEKKFPNSNIEYIQSDTKTTFDGLYVLKEELGRCKDYFLFTFADIIYKSETLMEFLNNCKKTKGDVIIGVSRKKTSDWAITLIEGDRVIDMVDKKEADYYSTSIMLFSPKVLKEVEKARELNIKKMNEFVNFLLKEGYDVRGIETEGIFDIDTMDVLEEAEKYFSG